MRKIVKTALMLGLIFCLCIATGCADPEYSATASIVATNGVVTVTGDKTTVSASDLSASLYLTETIVDILETPDIYKSLANELNNDETLNETYQYNDLMGMAIINRRDENSLLIDISFISTDPKEAMRLANKFAEIACEYIPQYIPASKVSVAATAVKATKQGIF